MANTTNTTSHVEESSHGESKDLLAPELTMVVLTWVTFFVLLAVLKKYAWQPILSTLQQREEKIRTSVDEAEKIQREYEQIEETKKKIIADGEEEAKSIINQSRTTAVNTSKIIEEKARQEAQIILENTNREIKAGYEKAEAQLRQESAELAIQLAEKLIETNLDKKANQQLVDKLIREI